MPQTPPAQPAQPAAPVITPHQVTVEGTPIASAYDVYQAFRAQRRVLGNQLDDLQNQRDNLSRELQTEGLNVADKKGLEQRITTVDERINALDKQIADADVQVAKAAAVPGAAVDPPEPPRTGPPEEFWVLTAIFGSIVLIPLTIAYARRIWRKGATVVTNIPKELTDRLMRVEQTVEASAIEIERIGEGQRFMTRLFTEGPQAAHALPSAAQHVVPSGKPGDVRP
ncbi:MAG TPA: hypothetical protein VFD22_01470 [Gemmatimonadaceae bacterium]|jgi:hypothetical protein|nr:hypothetical protein [Gemmatimonadaceae bacterium]